MAIISYSQAKEDIHLLRALKGVRHEDAFYIDVGANDPEIDSVTKLFYDHGWHGVNVEASPKWFAKVAQERPRDINIEAAVSDVPGELTFFSHDDGGLGTTVSDIADMHRREMDINLKEIKVKTITLNEICRQYAPKDINFLKIDVEGSEASVLRSINFSLYRPWILCIESHVPNHTDQQMHSEWEDGILSSEYHFAYTDGINRYYVSEEQKHRMETFTDLDYYVHHWDEREKNQLKNRVHDLESRINEIRNIVNR